MTPKLWAFAVCFYLLWASAGLVVTWSIYALPRGMPTTSQVMSDIGPLRIAMAGLLTGFVVNFVAAHWWVPSGQLRYAMLGIVAGLVLGGVAGGIWWPISR